MRLHHGHIARVQFAFGAYQWLGGSSPADFDDIDHSDFSTCAIAEELTRWIVKPLWSKQKP
jgi:hypothetical protein